MDAPRNARLAVGLALLAAVALAGCGGGGGSSGGKAENDLSDLALIDINVGGTAGVAINQIIVAEFTEDIVPGSVTPETFRIRLSTANAWQVPGDFNVNGNTIEFAPRLPQKAGLEDAGLAPGQNYEILLMGWPVPNTMTNAAGDPLLQTYSVKFGTAAPNSDDLFIDYNPNSTPHVVSVNPRNNAPNVPQNVTVELIFSEPMLPSTCSSANLSLTMIERPPGTQLSPERGIQGIWTLEQSRESVTVTFAPTFPLADDAKYRLNVDRRVTDLVKNDSIDFESFFTIRPEPPIQGSYTLDFGTASEIYNDTDVTIASWNRDVPGKLAAIWTAGAGNGEDGDLTPTFNQTLTATGDDDGNGIYEYRVIDIPQGVTVFLKGDVPITLLSLASVNIEGTIDASGQKGDKGESQTNTSSIPKIYGGDGGPGGGDGGDTQTAGAVGNSAFKGKPGTKGEDGIETKDTGGGPAGWGVASPYKYYNASGGGGGHRTAGKKGGPGMYTGGTYHGVGGTAGKADGTPQLVPMTGGGGGGACHNGYYYSPGYNNGGSGGGGGAGAGTIQCANDIVIQNGGELVAKGGDSGNAGATSAYAGGYGGAGAGGAWLVRALKDITIDNGMINVKGGVSGTGGGASYDSPGGAGGDGWIRLEDQDSKATLINGSTVGKYTNGNWVATGTHAPSVARTLWMNTGVYDPVFKPIGAGDVNELVENGTISIQIQMCPANYVLFEPDTSATAVSSWVPLSSITTLNGMGYSYFRLKMTMTVPSSQAQTDPMPTIDDITIRYTF